MTDHDPRTGTRVYGEGHPGGAPAGSAAGGHGADLSARAVLPQALRRRPGRPRRGALPRRPRPPAVHHARGSAGELPLRSVRRAPARGGAHPRLDLHVGRRRLHPQRHQDLVRARGARAGGGRRGQGRRGADRARLQPVDRRLRRALRRRAHRRLGHPDLDGQHPAAAQNHARFQDHRAGRHARLRCLARAHPAGAGHAAGCPVVARGPAGRRAPERSAPRRRSKNAWV